MTAAEIVQSELDGCEVEVVNALKMKAAGFIIGMSPDGRWYYVHDPKAEPVAVWHFKVGADSVKSVLKGECLRQFG